MNPEKPNESKEKRKNPIKVALRISLGIFCLIAAIAGAFLPIIPGFIFFFMGLLLLSFDFPFMKKPSEYIKKRFPKTKKTIETAEKNVWEKSGLGDE